MPKRLYRHDLVRYWYAYDLNEICILFDLNIQTIRKWIKSGLPTIDTKSKSLIYGNDLINFLKKKNDRNKRPTTFTEMYCVRCHNAKPIFQKKVTIEKKPNGLQLSGNCQNCKKSMFKMYPMDNLARIRRVFNVVEVLELYDCDFHSVKTHISNQSCLSKNESKQMELFTNE